MRTRICFHLMSFQNTFCILLVAFFFFFLERRHGRFIRKSIMSLSSISNECDDSFLLSLFELLTTLAAFFPTKGELTYCAKALRKYQQSHCVGLPHNVIAVHIYQHMRSSKDVAVMSHQCWECFCCLCEHVVQHQATLNGICVVLQQHKEVLYQWLCNLFVHY